MQRGKAYASRRFPYPGLCKGKRGWWLPDGMLASVATRVGYVMLDKPYGRGKPKGLFRQVQARYEASGTHEDFLRTVGEGALWATLLASLARMETTSLAGLTHTMESANSTPNEIRATAVTPDVTLSASTDHGKVGLSGPRHR
jgi:hypothetical protein